MPTEPSPIPVVQPEIILLAMRCALVFVIILWLCALALLFWRVAVYWIDRWTNHGAGQGPLIVRCDEHIESVDTSVRRTQWTETIYRDIQL